MSVTALQLQAVVTAETKGAEDGLGRVKGAFASAGDGIKGFLDNMLSVAGGIGVVNLAGDAIGFVKDQITDSISVAEQYQQVQAQLAAGIKSTNDASGETVQGLEDLAGQYSQVTTFSKATIEQAEGITLTFENIGKSVFPQATMAAEDMATRLGMDLPSATMLLDKALQDPIKGIAQLHRVGIDLSAQQIEQVKHFMAVNDVADAQKIILGEVNKEMGGSATAAGNTFAGALQIVQNQLEDTKDAVGSALLPVLAQLLKFLTPIISALSQGLASAIQSVSGWFTGTLMPAIKPFVDALPNLWLQLQNIGLIFLNGLKPGIDAVANAFSGLKGPGGDTQSLVQNLSIWLGKVATDFYGIGQAISDAIKIALPILGELWTIFTQDILPAVKALLPVVLGLAQSIGQNVAGVIKNILPTLKSFADWFTQTGVPAIKSLADFIEQKVLPVISTLVTTVVKDVVPAIQSMADTFIKQVLPAVEGLWNALAPILVPVLQWIAGFLVGVFKDAWNILANALALVINTITGLIGVIGGLFGAFGWVKDRIGDFLGLLGNVKDFIGNEFGNAVSGITGLFQNVFGGLWGIVKAPINLMIGGINTLIDGLDSIHFDIPGWVPGVGGKGFGISIPHIPLLAEGGTATEGGTAIVGERGAELITMPKGASVIPLPSGLSPAYGAASGSLNGQPIQVILNVDGVRLATIVSQKMPQAIRNATGQRSI